MKKKKTVAIVGGGLGGMAAAILLAKEGYRVTLFEKNERVGGKLNLLEEQGFKFDLGPSIFTLPQMFEPLFESEGKTLSDYVSLVRLDPQWRNFFEDGSCIDLYEDPARMKLEMDAVSPQAHSELTRFLEYSAVQYDIVEAGYFDRGLDTLWQFFKHYGFFGARKLDFKGSMAKGVERHFTDPRLRAIFEYFIKYVGSSAQDAPGFMNLMPTIQQRYGLWYVQGGLYELARAFDKRLGELGVEVRLNEEVVRIERSGKGVTGVVTGDGQLHFADAVVSNMEVIPAYQKLLGESARYLSKLEKFEPACSGLVLHLGVNRLYPQLAHHNFFYSRDQDSHFDQVFQKKTLPLDPTIYLVAPTRTDASQAPAGCDNLKILPHIPHLNGNYDREACLALKERVLDKLERMGLTDLRRHIVVEDMWTPFDIEKRYYSNKGSIYGVVSDTKKNFAFKAPKRSSKYRNLFFAGGSVNPGGGMPMVVLSGRHVARLVQEELGPA